MIFQTFEVDVPMYIPGEVEDFLVPCDPQFLELNPYFYNDSK